MEPASPPTGSKNGPVWDYQLYIANWFGMVLCDNQSYPEGRSTCRPDSDSNIQMPFGANHAGAAFLEMQFYPPGWPPFVSQISCDMTHWCASLHINSLQASYGPDGQATTDKQAFARLWNPLARRYGLRTYQSAQL